MFTRREVIANRHAPRDGTPTVPRPSQDQETRTQDMTIDPKTITDEELQDVSRLPVEDQRTLVNYVADEFILAAERLTPLGEVKDSVRELITTTLHPLITALCCGPDGKADPLPPFRALCYAIDKVEGPALTELPPSMCQALGIDRSVLAGWAYAILTHPYMKIAQDEVLERRSKEASS